ncbi:J domain-containing protein [Chloroflexota bacterium]
MKQIETILKDHYHTLGVSPTASSKHIKAAYRQLAHKFHPDVTPTGDIYKMTDINEAYEVLSDRLRRTTYDRLQQRQRSLWEEEIIKSTENGFSFYPIEPSTIAAQEASKGESREQIIDILVSNGIASDEAVEIVNEVFETQSMLKKQAVLAAIKFGALVIALDAIVTGILYAFLPAIDISTVLLIGLLFITGTYFIFEIAKKM